MIIKRVGEERLRFSFEPRDWKKGAMEFKERLKAFCPRGALYFDAETSEWDVQGGEAVTVFDDLRREYFTDDRQPSLF